MTEAPTAQARSEGTRGGVPAVRWPRPRTPTRQDLFTLPVSLVNLQQGAYGQLDFGLLSAGAVIAMIPCVILFVALQRFYVAGLSAGAVKG